MPEFNDAVIACRSIVRQATNREFAQYASQDAKLNSQDGLHAPMMESKFDAYTLPDGRLRALWYSGRVRQLLKVYERPRVSQRAAFTSPDRRPASATGIEAYEGVLSN